MQGDTHERRMTGLQEASTDVEVLAVSTPMSHDEHIANDSARDFAQCHFHIPKRRLLPPHTLPRDGEPRVQCISPGPRDAPPQNPH